MRYYKVKPEYDQTYKNPRIHNDNIIRKEMKIMDEIQGEIWDALCNLDGETVARLFTNYYGNQLLTDDFREFMEEEGVI